MPSVWLTSDTHFGHAGVCRFLREDGTKLRPWDDPNEMDEVLVKNWNDTVRPMDKVYHLGDVVINRRCLSTLERLNGDKILIRGNHDIFKLHDYTKYFRDIRGYHVMDRYILSHIPIHRESLYRWECNIHGHLHAGKVMEEVNGVKIEDKKYFSVCVENTNYTPILFEEVVKRIKERNESNSHRC